MKTVLKSIVGMPLRGRRTNTTIKAEQKLEKRNGVTIMQIAWMKESQHLYAKTDDSYSEKTTQISFKIYYQRFRILVSWKFEKNVLPLNFHLVFRGLQKCKIDHKKFFIKSFITRPTLGNYDKMEVNPHALGLDLVFT